jgi:hypothetical protein
MMTPREMFSRTVKIKINIAKNIMNITKEKIKKEKMSSFWRSFVKELDA